MIMIERVGKLVSKLNVKIGDLKSDWTGCHKPEPDSDLESEEITVRSIFSSHGIALPIRRGCSLEKSEVSTIELGYQKWCMGS
jgi:hypothetical protein